MLFVWLLVAIIVLMMNTSDHVYEVTTNSAFIAEWMWELSSTFNWTQMTIRTDAGIVYITSQFN